VPTLLISLLLLPARLDCVGLTNAFLLLHRGWRPRRPKGCALHRLLLLLLPGWSSAPAPASAPAAALILLCHSQVRGQTSSGVRSGGVPLHTDVTRSSVARAYAGL
jgi:hypothetical protein